MKQKCFVFNSMPRISSMPRCACIYVSLLALSKSRAPILPSISYSFSCKPILQSSLSSSLSRWLIFSIKMRELVSLIYACCLIIHLTKTTVSDLKQAIYILCLNEKKAKMIHIVLSASRWKIAGEKGSYKRGIKNDGCCMVLSQCLTPGLSS